MVGISLFVSVRDAREGIIPNTSCIILAACGICLQIVRMAAPSLLECTLWALVAPALDGAAACLIESALLLLGGAAAELLWRRHHRPALGLGDVKYAAAWTAVIGSWILPAIALAAFAGASVSLARGRSHFPFGPYLSFACVGVLIMVCTHVF